ncbi:MerR family transcriptional regulator [Streptomyces sp. NPDC005474]|uniref:MerR family transcriptional regulator n=1 Tax=Streptomyces sp. NPDC005474 TaxID=3154878 RepID=UPI0034519A1D
MRMSELSRRSGVSVTTIKYYLREGLLPAGRQLSATQAEYDESHLRALRLIRALIGVRGLSVSTTREVLGALAEESADAHRVLGLALGAIRLTGEGEADSPEAAEVDALIGELGWNVHTSAPARSALADTLASLRGLGSPLEWRELLPYARLAEETAVLDLDQLDGIQDPLELAERALLLTVLLEPALLALRRMAQQNESARRHADTTDN